MSNKIARAIFRLKPDWRDVQSFFDLVDKPMSVRKTDGEREGVYHYTIMSHIYRDISECVEVTQDSYNRDGTATVCRAVTEAIFRIAQRIQDRKRFEEYHEVDCPYADISVNSLLYTTISGRTLSFEFDDETMIVSFDAIDNPSVAFISDIIRRFDTFPDDVKLDRGD